jgi:hypothetical protein
MTQAVFETTATALREKSKLQRHFRRFDVFFYLICTMVTIDTIGAVASNGAQGFTWLIFLGVLFFLPYALSVAELGSAFPQEGGPYVWSRLAFGRPLAAINSAYVPLTARREHRENGCRARMCHAPSRPIRLLQGRLPQPRDHDRRSDLPR